MSATADRALEKLTARERAALVAALRRELRDEVRAAERERRARERRERVVESEDYADAARRMIRALGRRAGTDVDALPLLEQLRDVVDDQLADAISAARSGESLAGGRGWSWADVARVLGGDRQRWQQWHARHLARRGRTS